MNTPVRPAQGALAVRSMLYVSIAAAADRVWAVPALARAAPGENIYIYVPFYRPPGARVPSTASVEKKHHAGSQAIAQRGRATVASP